MLKEENLKCQSALLATAAIVGQVPILIRSRQLLDRAPIGDPPRALGSCTTSGDGRRLCFVNRAACGHRRERRRAAAAASGAAVQRRAVARA